MPGIGSQPAVFSVWLCIDGWSSTFPKLLTFIVKRTVLPGAVVLILDSIAGSSSIRISWNSTISMFRTIVSLNLVPSYGSSLKTSRRTVYSPA